MELKKASLKRLNKKLNQLGHDRPKSYKIGHIKSVLKYCAELRKN